MKKIDAPKELQEKIDDVLDVVGNIQGDKFRDLLAFVLQSTQVMRLASVGVAKYEDDLAKTLAEETAKTLSLASSMIADAYELNDKQLEELMKWVETVDGHVISALKEANK